MDQKIIERWNDSKDAWSELYASRCVKIISSATVTLNKDDDFIVSVSPNSRINLPTGNSNGKIITIKTIGHTTNIQPQSGYQIYTDHSIPYGGSGIDLNNYEKELWNRKNKKQSFSTSRKSRWK